MFRRGPVTYTYTFTSGNDPAQLMPMPPHMGFHGESGAGGPGSLDLTNLQARHYLRDWSFSGY